MRGLMLAAAAAVASVAAQGGPPIALYTCSASRASTQVWTLAPSPSSTLSLAPGQGGARMCIDISDFSTDVNATVYTWPCGTGGANSNEWWAVSSNSIKSLETGGKCLGLYPGSSAVPGAQVTTVVCDASDPSQSLSFSATTGLITHGPSGLCIDAAVPPNFCGTGDHASWTICDPLAPIDARAADIVSRMSLADKILALNTGAPNLPSIGLAAYDWWSEATHGISHVSYTGSLPYASNTALPITTGASFNRSLWAATAAQIGREARAFMNAGQAHGSYWAPVINTVRDPRWGRNIETPGEDPFVVGEYSIAWVRAFEHAPEDPYTLQASACCKHYVANELDGFNGTDRHHFNAIVTDQDLQDTYMVPFQACVEQGRVSGIMCSYNAVNGIPSCANDWLLGTVLRGEWAFDGYVTSDCDADADVYNDHHYTDTPEETVAAVLRAGTDVDCGSFVTTHAGSALNQSVITEADIDTVLQRLFRVRIRLGYFDGPSPLDVIGPKDVCNDYAVELARDGARQGSVLLKNVGATLPLSAASYKSAVVIGPNALLNNTVDYYGGRPCFNAFTTPTDAITQFIPSTSFILGVPDVGSNNTSGVAAAAAAAASADLVILAIGSDLMLEAEGHDRTEVGFSGGQLALIAAVASAAKAPVVALVFSGGAMDVSPLLSNAGVHAVVHAGQPSVQVGGVADVVFGRTLDGRPVVPAARMGQTTYPASYAYSVSLEDFNMRPGPSAYPPGTNPGRTYRFYTGQPVLPIGFGLSYTTFAYSAPSRADGKAADAVVPLAPIRSVLETAGRSTIPKALIEGDAPIAYYVNVTNTGSIDADDVVLGFLVPPGAGVNGVPLQEIFGFERVHVPAGQTVTVYLGVQGRFLTQVGPDGVRRAHPGEYGVRIGVAETASLGMGFSTGSFVVA